MSTTGATAELLTLQLAVAGRYSIEREIGRGGMGIVYLAKDVALDRLVAIKVLPARLASDPAVRERFEQEARTAAKLSHPNIVPIHSVETAGDFVFFVMAYVDGETLGQRVAAGGPLPVAAGTRILRDVAWALSYAHAQGVVHRDVKPDNILLERGTDRALVTDFGIAQVGVTGGDAASRADVMGTPEFMSPEQATGEPVDRRSDLYSLALVAFYALSGRTPFASRRVPELLAQQIAKPAPPLASAAPGVPRRVAAAVDRCLAKAPADRVQSAEEVAEILGTGAERRRELPTAVRVFVAERKAGETRTAVAVAMAPWMLMLLAGLFATGQPVIVILGGGLFGGVAAWLLSQLVGSVRRLLAAGHGQDDALLGLELEVERRREELAHIYGDDHEEAARRYRRTAVVMLSGAVATLGANVAFVGDMLPLAAGLAGVAAAIGIVAWRKAEARTDRKGPRRLKFWRGAVGRLLFRVASNGIDVRPEVPALTHRPTEIAIGMVVEGLYAALPTATRTALGDLPAVVRGLETDAQRMRVRIEEIDALLANAPATEGERGERGDVGDLDDAARVLADLRATRERAARRMADIVAALEKLRVDLLRLRAGDTTLAGVTTNLGLARDLTEQVDRLVDGYAEVEAVLQA